ncbi:MAG: TadE/TadG family type IV pilus assembly protein [Sphingobium sp.]
MRDTLLASMGFLSRLRRNQAGNALAIVAAAIIPLLGLVGGGIDMSRLYLTKSRLQQACDAGALAGRKQMGSGAWSANSGSANAVAEQLFDANFGSDPYGTNNTARSFAESGGKVTGTASVVVPMTVMRALGQTDRTVNTSCEADMRIPNTDIMFVLDVTGSMGDKANSKDTVTKIDGLKNAVLCFYEALAKIDTTANCGTTPTTSNSSTAQIRFGFVPYAVNVNVGKLLRNAWMADSWDYQSRVYSGKEGWGYWKTRKSSSNNCPSDTAKQQYRKSSFYGKCDQERSYGPLYIYKQRTLNVSGLKGGSDTWNSSVLLPLGANKSISVAWDGCIEERETVRQASYSPIPAAARDLDIDLVPSTGDPATQWKPQLPGAVWARHDEDKVNQLGEVTADEVARSSSSCPTEAQRLQVWPSPSNTQTFESYVNSLSTGGNTYHDIGLLWGARLASPTGLFAADNKTTPTGGGIERHIIFMTDGNTQTSVTNYNAYGIPWWDRRQTAINVEPTSSTTNNQVNARFSALCTAIKNKGFTLWTIYFGVEITEKTNKATRDAADRLATCASSDDHSFTAADSATLIANFQSIADNISQLRLTQ